MKYLFIISIIFISACATEVPLPKTNNVAQKPVVHLFLCPDSSLQASFSLSANITGKSKEVSGAYFSAFINNNFIDYLSESSPGKYQSAFNNAKPLDSFKFDVGLEQPEFSVYGRIPNHFEIEKVDTQSSLSPQNGSSLNFRMTFFDSAKYENYYRLYVWFTYYEYKRNLQGNIIDSSLKKRIINIAGADLPFSLNHFNSYTGNELLFTDETFNGTRLSLNFSTSENVRKSPSRRPVSAQVVLENINPVLYRFYNTRNAHIWQQNSITQIPGPIEGNIPRGYGVIGAYTVKSITIHF